MRCCWIWALLGLISPGLGQGTYSNPSLGFAFTPPSGWALRKSMDRSVDTILSFAQTGAAAKPAGRKETDQEFLARVNHTLHGSATAPPATMTVVVANQAGDISLRQYVDRSRAQAMDYNRRHNTAAYKIFRETYRPLAGEKAIVRDMLVRLPGEPPIRLRELMCVHSGRLYTLSASAEPAGFDRTATDFDKALAGFMWISRSTVPAHTKK